MSLSPRQVPVEPLDAHRFELGECARWDGRRLSVIDLLAGDLWVSDRGGHLEHHLHLDVPLGAAIPAAGGGFVLAAGDGVAFLGPDDALTWWAHPAAGLEPARRMNDAAADPAGQLWFGSMDYSGTLGNGTLYRMAGDRAVVAAVSTLGCPNGPAFSADGTWMYLSESDRGVIHRYPLGADGEPGTPTTFVDAGRLGLPDGLTLDAEDHLWVAFWGGAAIGCFNPAGQLVDLIAVPVKQPSSVCITGDGLIVTSARGRLVNSCSLDGAVLRLDVPVEGRAATAFDPQ